MKRLNLVLFGVFLLNFSVFAQIGGTTQRGKATHEMDSEEFFIAHSSFPLGSTIKVVNTATGEAINAVVSGRIRASPSRVVDLSNGLWDALGLTEDSVVMLVYVPPVITRQPPAIAEPAAEIAKKPAEPATETAETAEIAEKTPESAAEIVESVVENPELAAKIVDTMTELAEKLTQIQDKLTELTEKLAQLQEREARIAEKEAELAEKKAEEAAQLKTAQPLYQLLIIDRRYCEENSDISDLQDIKLLYKFLHEEKGYLIAAYASYNNEPVFPVMPVNSLILVNMTSGNLSMLRDYINTSEFQRYVSSQYIISQLLKALR